MGLSAHLWTVWPLVRERFSPQPQPAAEEWSLDVDDPSLGRVRLTGLLRQPEGSTGLVVLIHGLGGSATGRYMTRAAHAADEMGLATLRLNLRGADRRGGDLYHAGLTSDLAAALVSPRLAGMANLYVLGYSLGGHLALKLATEVEDARLRAAAAVCSPLDLDRTVRAFDRPSRWPYRRYVLSGLFEIYDEIARRRDVPVPPEEVRRVRLLRDFDRLTVVPRFGFDSAEDYYRRAGVGPRLGELRVPALLVAAEGDPMVDAHGIRPALDGGSTSLDVRWLRSGGHVSFPGRLDLGLGPPYGLERQVLAWLTSAGRAHSLDD